MTTGSDSSRVRPSMSSTQRLVVQDQQLGGYRTLEVPEAEIFMQRGPGGELVLSPIPGPGPLIGLRSSSTGIVITRGSEGVSVNGQPVEVGRALGRFDLLEFAGALFRSEEGLSSSGDLETVVGHGDTRQDSGSAAAVAAALPEVGGAPFAGRYQLQEVLGRGGFGAVYRAWDTQLQRPVAIKVLVRAEGRALQRFAMEIRAMASLRHPNLVTVFDSGIEGEHPYLVMELIEGVTLDRLVSEGISPTRAATILRDITRAVTYAHQQGMLHRDLKPMNIIVQPDGLSKLVDFGLVRLFGPEGLGQTQTRITREGTRLGTLPYMSPEQAFAGEQDERSEVYGLGATLYHTLVGEHPFAGAEELLLAIVNTQPDLPCERDPSIPPDLEAICLKCLEKRPRDRYPTAAALGADLDRFLGGESTVARPLGLWGMQWRRLLRGGQQPLLLAAAALVLVMGAGAAFLIHRERTSREQAEREQAAAAKLLADQQAEEQRLAALAAEAAAATQRKVDGVRERLDALGHGQAVAPDPLRVEAVQLGDAAVPAILDWLGALSEELLGIERQVYLEANVLRAGEEKRIVGLATAVDAAAQRRLGDVTPARDAEILGRARERLVARAEGAGEHLTFEELVARAQLARLGADRFRAADLALQILGELARVEHHRPELIEPLVRHLKAEAADRRALAVGDVLIRVEGGEVLRPLMAAAIRFGAGSAFAKELGPRMGKLAGDAPPAAETAAGYFERGLFFHIVGENQAALKALGKVIDLDPFHERAFTLRANVRRVTGDPDGARSDLDKAIELLPLSAKLWCERADLRLSVGDARGALTDARRALELSKDSARAYHLSGRAHGFLGEYEEALQAYSEAIRLEPGFAAAWASRAVLRSARRQTKEALADATKATRLDPDNGQAWGVIGRIALLQRQYSAAVEALSRAVEHDPNAAEHSLNRGIAYAQLGRSDGALQDFNEAIRKSSEERLPMVLVLRAKMRELQGDDAGARKDFDWAVKLAPNEPLPRKGRAQLLARTGEVPFAIQDCLKVIEAEPRNPVMWALLAELRFASGNDAGGEQALATAFRLEPRSAAALMVRGLRALERKDYSSALRDFDEATGIAPSDARLWYHRAQALARLGRKAEAKDLLQRYLTRVPRGYLSGQARELLDALD